MSDFTDAMTEGFGVAKDVMGETLTLERTDTPLPCIVGRVDPQTKQYQAQDNTRASAIVQVLRATLNDELDAGDQPTVGDYFITADNLTRHRVAEVVDDPSSVHVEYLCETSKA